MFVCNQANFRSRMFFLAGYIVEIYPHTVTIHNTPLDQEWKSWTLGGGGRIIFVNMTQAAKVWFRHPLTLLEKMSQISNIFQFIHCVAYELPACHRIYKLAHIGDLRLLCHSGIAVYWSAGPCCVTCPFAILQSRDPGLSWHSGIG